MATKLKPLAEQVIVITGASSGIGLATAELATKRGAKVVLAELKHLAAGTLTGFPPSTSGSVTMESNAAIPSQVSSVYLTTPSGDTSIRSVEPSHPQLALLTTASTAARKAGGSVGHAATMRVRSESAEQVHATVHAGAVVAVTPCEPVT